MSGSNTIAVGIDLGTTYSAVAVLDEHGHPRTILNAEGEKLTPSAVFFTDDDVIVGKEAIKALATHAADVAQCAKRDLGMRVFHKPLAGRQFPPEAIQAWVLNKLRKDVAGQLGEYNKVVVTVPAYFDESRRKATQDAGYIAGLEVMDIINEPTAAAVAFGYQKGYFHPHRGSTERQRILVYDLGGGTFDITVMEIRGSDFVTLATDGDVMLGGYDWDERLVDYVAEEYVRRFGMDPREDPNTHGRLWRDCEEAKRTLTARHKAHVACDYLGNAVRLEITRELFCSLTQDLLDRTSFTTRQTLAAAGMTWRDVDRILLVGGSSRMPAVQEMLRNMSGKVPDCSVSPDEAVAHGAALHAGLLLDKHHGRVPRFNIHNVNSHSLGVVGTDPLSRQPRTAVLIPRNTPIPITAKRVFKTQKASQRSILVQIVEGESPHPEDCLELGKCTVRELPERLPAQTPIEIRFRYEENGRLTVTVLVEGTDITLQHQLARENSLTQEQLNSWRDFLSRF